MTKTLSSAVSRLVVASAVALALSATAADASQQQFCAGFEAGWKAAFEERSMLAQLTPLCPLAPLGRDTFASGYEFGLRSALAKIGR